MPDETKTIQVRHVPVAVHAALRRQAVAEGVSLSDLVLGELAVIAGRMPMAEVLRRAGARPGGTTTAAIVAVVRDQRDRLA
jgi:hypothetical protein